MNLKQLFSISIMALCVSTFGQWDDTSISGQITTNDKVGIGTDSPSDGLLHIFRDATTGGIESVNPANAGIRIQDSYHNLYIDGNTLYTTGNMIMGTMNSSTLTLGTNSQSRIRINENGLVGIGKLTPSESILNIYRNTTIGAFPNPNLSNSVVKIEDSSNNLYLDGNAIISDASATSTKFSIGTTGPANLSLGTNSLERLRITGNGKIGIGTSNPDAKLTVKGTIHSQEVKIDLSVPGPDYVFESDYNLRTLEETEAYIKSNKHLPEVPSAEEMEANGVQLGEMNMLLLKKIEELTLYLIEQQKINKELNQRIEKLENQSK